MLKQAMTEHPSARTRMRAHAILLSERQYAIDQIADIYEVERDSVSAWLDRWEGGGVEKLDDAPRSGRPPPLTDPEQPQAVQLARQEPRSPRQRLEPIESATGKKISRDPLKRLLKKGGLVWKRIRQSLRSQREAETFRAAPAALATLRAQAATGQGDLYYYAAAGFSLPPCVPYAWQPIGQTLEVPAAHGPRLNGLAFLGLHHQFHPFVFAGTLDTPIVSRCFDSLSQLITKPTLVVIDNASTHTSGEFATRIETWAQRGLSLKFLPPYCPELNLIEILWRKIKYEWLPLSAYTSFQALARALDDVLIQVGSKYRINFA